MVAEQPGSSMPKNTKGMKFNPNRDAHSSLSEVNLSIQTNKQTINWDIMCLKLKTLKHILFKPNYTCSSVHSGWSNVSMEHWISNDTILGWKN